MNNKTYKLPDVKNVLNVGIERVNADMWKIFIRNTKKEEDTFWEMNFIVDEVLSGEVESVLMIIGDTTSDESIYLLD